MMFQSIQFAVILGIPGLNKKILVYFQSIQPAVYKDDCLFNEYGKRNHTNLNRILQDERQAGFDNLPYTNPY